MKTLYSNANAQFEKIGAAGTVIAEGVQGIINDNMSYWERSARRASTFAERALSTKSVETAVQLHADFAKSQAEDFVAQLSKIGEFCKGIATEVFKPIRNAASAATEAAAR